MSRLQSVVQSVKQMVAFMRKADNVTSQADGGFGGSLGGQGMTAEEAKMLLRHLVDKFDVTRREMTIALRDIRGLKADDRTKLKAAMQASGAFRGRRGPALPPEKLVDIGSEPGGGLKAKAVREFLKAMVKLKAKFNSVTFLTERTDGGRRNYSLQADNSGSGRRGFSERDAARCIEFLRGCRVSAGQIRSAAGGLSNPAKDLLLGALGSSS